jgi:hypothetical protein
MKYKVTRFKNLIVALKELEPFVQDGEHLQTGKPFKRFGGLRSRELLANWLLCVVLDFDAKAGRFTFTSDPSGGDGVICDGTTKRTYPTEHVLVPSSHAGETGDVQARILNAIASKQRKGGTAYASGKTLVVCLNAGEGRWYPNRVAKQLPKELDFVDVWVVGLQDVEEGEYIYHVARLLDVETGDVPVWLVRISKHFDGWHVERIQ